ncbi:hypothetical protein H9Q69_003267 [Fusarium xylarioides]|uniref:Uncharacterized protein n=1 Tax=Fusarium xylarioides TaxID=221167 RepID=A0A9P7IID1_9HYPO|nr:hypothetical protein H9Q70_010569 [Fusarium xylarioides]KAG5765039.1 hypothetical protein H9Q72_006882 [Fusarium xylarioides]KAG5775008.1 hypothetical protein H9Q73_011305 [Fusarium xylarioides]KAG5797671.1 hypothetical protein H9Q69_003267 [Fusarium xylarioides]KAG5803400.1 hypothetical protein H9Q71_012020 [Fusarium xylarioides]
MAKKPKPTLRERRALQALREQSAPALAPPSSDIDMTNTETPPDQQETLVEFDASRDNFAVKTRLDQQDEDIEENRELIAIAGAKIFELEPVVNKIEDEFPIVKKKLHAYCKKTLDGFSDELDDMARVDSDKWSRINDRGKMSELIDKALDENAKLKEKIKKQNSALLKHAIALREEKEVNAQLKADVASIMRRLAAVEDVVHPDMCEAAEKKFGEMGVSDTQ